MVLSKKDAPKTKQFRDLTDDQWALVSSHIVTPRKRKSDLRQMLNAILKIVRTGVQWRNMDKAYGDWRLVYYYYQQWQKLGLITLILKDLVELERLRQGRKKSPSRVAVDSQSVKIAPFISSDKGIDGNKKINGRKRHIMVDSLGLPIAIFVSAANMNDGKAGFDLLWRAEKWDKDMVLLILADAAYRGEFVTASGYYNYTVDISQKPETTKGFVPQTGRWQVERSFAWLNFYRRLCKDYEKTVESAVTFIELAFISIILARLQN
jgi:transposase